MRIDDTLTPGDGEPNFGKPHAKFLPVGAAPPVGDSFYLLEAGTDVYLMEDGSKYVIE